MDLRTKIISIMMCLCSMQAITAELHGQSDRMGIKLGFNLSYLNIDEAVNKKPAPGFHAGIWGKKILKNNIGLQVEMNYSTKGVRAFYNEEFTGIVVSDNETRFNLEYIDIPIFLAIKSPQKKIDFRFGPYIGYLLNAEMEFNPQLFGAIGFAGADQIDHDEFNRLDTGITGGVGFYLGRFTFGVNYQIGLIPVVEKGERLRALVQNAHNSVFQAYIGVGFYPKKQN